MNSGGFIVELAEATTGVVSAAGRQQTKLMDQKWEKIKKRLRAELGEDVFTSWFGRVELESLDEGCLQVSVPTKFLSKWLRSHYADHLLKCCRAEFEDVERLEFRVRQPHDALTAERHQTSGPRERKDEAVAAPAMQRPAADTRTGCEGFEGSPLDTRFTFDSFLVGNANRLAHAAALQVVESAGEQTSRYNPLYLHGNVGLGKTHLLHAIAWGVKQRKPAARLLYLTAERFMYSFADALQSRGGPAYKDRLRGIDVLLIDDMEFLQGRTFQQEFCHTLNSLIDGGKQVVVAADCVPMQLEGFDARMRSRLAGGLVAELGAMDYDLRLQILKRRVQDKTSEDPRFQIPDAVIDFLASELTEGGRELEGAITRIHAAYKLTSQPVTLETAQYITSDLVRGKEPKKVMIDDILRVVTKHYGVNRSDLLSSRRNRSIVRPRQIGMYLAKSLTARSLPEIGRRFGGRDHTTVLHAIRKVDELIGSDTVLREDVEILKRLLRD